MVEWNEEVCEGVEDVNTNFQVSGVWVNFEHVNLNVSEISE